ncbi:NAD(P)H-dependent amine dehydrogenase family protein [Pseudofrankia inefficax]|uniref:Dihydrodipicolinate reductase n=1 Tax=Pseudofrankia inefficax (strain DSM 45817 / CECT 9037 / DDB 130130 / EuI1c) TaxID=298654 RepID=E3JAS9_PSEI1|nr:dihydrodipicolinate reductase [Pseudofrankia inefficax]ADP83417.1 dihydrodipicolinate reductase [Pseudofrankia inefficax]
MTSEATLSESGPTGAPLRVVQWATGNIGTRSLMHVINHPRLELVGLYVYDEAKAGKDAGELAGLDVATGVAATRDVAEILALGADCVLYMPRYFDGDEVARILASGANIVTTRGEFHRPASIEPGLRAQIEKACAEGGTSVHSTGSSPGFISEAVPLVLSSLQRRLDRIVINEYADMSKRDSPGLLFDVMGYGKPIGPFDAVRAEYLAGAFGPSLSLLADALGMPIDEFVSGGELAAAADDIEIAAGLLPKGSIAAQRVSVVGMRGGKPFLEFHANWYCTKDLEPAWDDLLDSGWRITVEGDSPMDIALTFTVPLEKMAETSPNFTANRAVNAVAALVAAAPGIRTTLDLPFIIGTDLV